jgi:TRAP-type C4-dicarboxylate transport system permease small subunit
MQGIHRFMTAMARIMAVLGGIVLLALIVITCVSILGRALNTALHSGFMQAAAPDFAQALIDWGIGAIRGDFELVEAGMAFCIFAFLPLCQVTAGHATVDILIGAMPRPARRVFVFLGEALFAVALVVIAQQLYLGMDSKLRSGQTSFLLQYPVWWGYAAALVGAVAAAVAGVYMALVRTLELLTGRVIVPNAVGTDH